MQKDESHATGVNEGAKDKNLVGYDDGSRFSLFKKSKLKLKWPNPEQSVGRYCGIMKDKYRCWEAKGDALEAFEKLGPEISILLERSCSPVPASSQIIYDIFMVGLNPETALPHIMFSCIETGHWQFPTHIIDPQFLASQGQSESVESSEVFLVPLYGPNLQTATSTTSEAIIAMKLYLEMPLDRWVDLPKATIGCTIHIYGKKFYLSVSHAFIPSSTSTQNSLNTEDSGEDSEVEFGGLENDYESSDNKDLEQTSRGSMTPEFEILEEGYTSIVDENFEKSSLPSSNVSSASYPQTNHNSETEKLVRERTPEITVVKTPSPEHYNATAFLMSGDLDYALIEINSGYPLNPGFDSLPILSSENVTDTPDKEVSIITVTGSSGRLFGELSGKPSYIRLLRSTTFQKVYTVILKGTVNPGDSGSVFLNAETFEVYGHIVAGSTISRTAYMIPAISLLQDLESRKSDNTGNPPPTLRSFNLRNSNSGEIHSPFSSRAQDSYQNIVERTSILDLSDEMVQLEGDSKRLIHDNMPTIITVRQRDDSNIKKAKYSQSQLYESTSSSRHRHQHRRETTANSESKKSSSQLFKPKFDAGGYSVETTDLGRVLPETYGTYPNQVTDILASGIQNLAVWTGSKYSSALYPQMDEISASGISQTLPDPAYESMANLSSPPNVQPPTVVEKTGRLDTSYQVRRKDYKEFFKVGRVFSILWSESMGITENINESQNLVDIVAYGENVHMKIRRFVVVKLRGNSCSCLPVTSYGKKGVNKAGIILSDHGFIYNHAEPNRAYGLGAEPLKIILSRGGSDLTNPSLVNYSKVYTIEADMKVKDIGKIDPEYIGTLRFYFNKIFNGIEEHIPTSMIAEEGLEALSGGEGNLTSPSQSVTLSSPYKTNPSSESSTLPFWQQHVALPESESQLKTASHTPNWEQQVSTTPYSPSSSTQFNSYTTPSSFYPVSYTTTPRTTAAYTDYTESNYQQATSSYSLPGYIQPPNIYPSTVSSSDTAVSSLADYQVAYGLPSSYTDPGARETDLDLDLERHARQRSSHREAKKKRHRR
ncbi:hypothetical protein B7463_g834, partial [Scytalidium lignicola]